jgi:hypothetical protein
LFSTLQLFEIFFEIEPPLQRGIDGQDAPSIAEAISVSSASETISVQVSDRRGSVFDEAYTDFVSGTPQHFGAMNPSFDGDVQFKSVDYWRSRKKFEPGAGIRNIVYDAFNRGTRFTKIREPMQITFHDPTTNRFDKSPPVMASRARP